MFRLIDMFKLIAMFYFSTTFSKDTLMCIENWKGGGGLEGRNIRKIFLNGFVPTYSESFYERSDEFFDNYTSCPSNQTPTL